LNLIEFFWGSFITMLWCLFSEMFIQDLVDAYKHGRLIFNNRCLYSIA